MSMQVSELYSITYPEVGAAVRPSLVEHKGQLFCAKESGLCSSSDGINWTEISTTLPSSVFCTLRLASFNGLLWAAYQSGSGVVLKTSNDGGRQWADTSPVAIPNPRFPEMPIFLMFNTMAGPFDIIVQAGKLYVVIVLSQGICLAYTNDGTIYQPYGNSFNRYSIYSPSAAINSITLSSFRGVLYSVIGAGTGTSDLLTFDNSSDSFSKTYTFAFEPVSLVNTGDSLMSLCENVNQPGKPLCYQQSTDGQTWSQELTSLPNVLTSGLTSGLIFNGSLFIINSLKKDDKTFFNIITNTDSPSLKETTFKEKNYVVDSGTDFSITTLCPRVHIEAYSSYIALGKGIINGKPDGNYYYVYFSQDSANTTYVKLQEEPSAMITNTDVSWVSFSGANKLYIYETGAVNSNTGITLSQHNLLMPVCGGSKNEIIVQDTSGALFVGTVQGGASHPSLNHQKYQLSPCGDVGAFSDGTYLYIYNQVEDILEVYDITTSSYGSPICSSSKLGLSNIPSGSKVKVSQDNSHLKVVISNDSTYEILLVTPYEQGDKNLDVSQTNIKIITPEIVSS